MAFSDYTKRVLGLAETVYRWLLYLGDLDPARRERIATYADAIGDSLARARSVLIRLNGEPDDRNLRLEAVSELARINGYVETIVEVLEHQLDGRKLAGVKRRLQGIGKRIVPAGRLEPGGAKFNGYGRLERLAAAEGYFRALADGLRA